MRVQDKPNENDNAWLMRVQDKPNENDNAWLMRVQDKPNENDNAWLMRVQDKPNENDNAWLMRVQDKPNENDNAWLMRVQDKPNENDNAWLMRVQDKPNENDNAWLMRVQDKPNENDNAWLMRVQDKPNENDNAWLMRVQDKPNENDNAWLMRVQDKPNENDNAWLMRVQDKPNENDNAWLMRVQDKPNENDNAWLMRVQDKPNENDNAWLMRVQDKPNENDNAWLMRVQDKPNENDNAWLMRVQDKPNKNGNACSKKRNNNAGVQNEQNKSLKLSFLDITGVIDNAINVCCASNARSHQTVTKLHYSKDVSWLSSGESTPEKLEKKNSSNFSGDVLSSGSHDYVLRDFWSFRYSVNKEHQMFAIYALGGDCTKIRNTKTEFYNKLKQVQGLDIPFRENEIILSFRDVKVVEAMYRAGLLVNPKHFILSGKHVFNSEEEFELREKTRKAMIYIRKTDETLYRSLVQVVACIGYYKAAGIGHLGGTVSSAVGLIWLDPSKGSDWSVPFLAEQIVHEYIHTTLFMAEMVRGTYSDTRLVSSSMVISAIRRQKRGYDKSFHAAYVATGLVAFHVKADFPHRAAELALHLNVSVHDLETVTAKTGVLDRTGMAMLVHLKEFLRKMNVM
ncbi:Hypothetical predicted protein [Paramuricea clavata]|uniref:Uncharacterized protein n=1 Tax=Paramuricea clavata TaxID=317549 RepID=A0A6S7JZ62_PARCT|nr:Hypothetical predicted protein [Paramuricea clavata]